MFYTVFITALASAFLISLATRNPLRVDVMRDRGALAREIEGTMIENVYRLQIMNASENPMRVTLTPSGLPNMMVLDSQAKPVSEVVVNPSSNLLLPIKIRVKIDDVEKGNHPIHFDVKAKEEGVGASDTVRVRDEKSSFIVPR